MLTSLLPITTALHVYVEFFCLSQTLEHCALNIAAWAVGSFLCNCSSSVLPCAALVQPFSHPVSAWGCQATVADLVGLICCGQHTAAAELHPFALKGQQVYDYEPV